jgi:D-alanine-D-alanine ligase
MTKIPTIAVLSGGISPEREVSLVTGKAVADSLEKIFPVERFVLDENELPRGLNPLKHIVFPAMHGTFGEDGGLQGLLEAAGFSYAGSGAHSSRLCMDKVRTKGCLAPAGVRVSRGILAQAPQIDASRVIHAVGEQIIVKPSNQGSSVGLHSVEGVTALSTLLAKLDSGEWLFEEKIVGREFSIGLLGGRALGVVEIIPMHGSYDYEHKYTPGTTEYRFPATIAPELEAELKVFSEKAFSMCGCRDFARADFMTSAAGEAYFLEINTIPGLTPTSLLPKSASCNGHDFDTLMRLMIEPAIERFYAATLIHT